MHWTILISRFVWSFNKSRSNSDERCCKNCSPYLSCHRFWYEWICQIKSNNVFFFLLIFVPFRLVFVLCFSLLNNMICAFSLGTNEPLLSHERNQVQSFFPLSNDNCHLELDCNTRYYFNNYRMRSNNK